MSRAGQALLGFVLVAVVVTVGMRILLGGTSRHLSAGSLSTPSAVPSPTASATSESPPPTAPAAQPTLTPRAAHRTVTTPRASATTPPRSAATGSLRGLVIAIDPGHNGANGSHPAEINRPVDAGGFTKPCNTTGTATNDGYPEATFNWQLANRLGELLAARGATVRMTRTSNDGWGPCVDARGRFGRSVGAAAEISLHADGAPAGGHGFHVIVPAYKRGYTDDILPASSEFGTTLRDALVTAGFTPSTYVGHAGLDVRDDLGTLNLAGVPTVMLECGNMRNAADAAMLRTSTGQQRLAGALASAISARFGQ